MYQATNETKSYKKAHINQSFFDNFYFNLQLAPSFSNFPTHILQNTIIFYPTAVSTKRG